MSFSFKGGIHPPENKKITEDKKFINLSIPHVCYIPMQQHIGAPARPVVEVGENVKEGQLIGKAEGFISANIHASIPGKVVAIENIPTVHQEQPGVIIEAEGEFSASSHKKEPVNWKGLSSMEIVENVKEAGVVGMGGAAFPTSVKLSPPPDKEIDTLIINGAECEPYLTIDDMFMKTFPEEIIEGVQITLKALGIKNAIIGIENNKSNAAKILNKTIQKIKPAENIKVKKLRTKYPQGAEKQLIYSLLKRSVPSGGLPMDIGVVVQNVGTISAIRDSVLYHKSLFERHITVSGQMINNPGNYKVRLGMRIIDLIEECGGLKGEPAKVVMGGPMCGASLHSLDVPVVKGTSGVLFLSEDEISFRNYKACIRCGKCVSACPVGLLPSDLGNAVEKNRMDLAAKLNPSDCIMCGSCSYSCPANRPLSHFIKLAQERTRT